MPVTSVSKNRNGLGGMPMVHRERLDAMDLDGSVYTSCIRSSSMRGGSSHPDRDVCMRGSGFGSLAQLAEHAAVGMRDLVIS